MNDSSGKTKWTPECPPHGRDNKVKIIDVNFSRHERLLLIKDALELMGHSVRLVYSDNYYHTVPYYKKKLDKLGFHAGHRRYRDEKRNLLFSWVREWRPDRVLFLNPPEHFLSPEELVSLRRTVNEQGGLSVGWFVDKAVKRHYIPYYDGFDRIFTYERQEVDTLRRFYGTNAEYGFVGYNPAYESPVAGVPPPVDIAFIGSLYWNSRMPLLEAVAKEAAREGWTMRVYGPWYRATNIATYLRLRLHYPHTLGCLQNREVASEEAAAIYAGAKIAINIHGSTHRALNPRTFEILAAGAMELLDEREYYEGLCPDEDIVTFGGRDDIVGKVRYYMTHEKERREIADAGHKKAIERYSIKESLKKVLCEP